MLYMGHGRKSAATDRIFTGFHWGPERRKIGSCWGSTKMNLYISVKPCESRFPSSVSVTHQPKSAPLGEQRAKEQKQ